MEIELKPRPGKQMSETDACPLAPEGVRRGRPAAGQDPVKRKQILDGARRVFIDMGFDAASMNDITREAGVSKGTIYVYFANKEELFEAIVEEERGSIFNNLYGALESGDGLRETLINFGMALSFKITCDKVISAQRTVIGVSERMPDLGRRFYERGPMHGHKIFVDFLEAAMKKGLLDIKDVRLAAYQFTDLAMAGLFRQCIFAYRSEPPGEEEIRYVVTAGVDIFLNAYGTEKLRRLMAGGKG
jgi:AcrR family transcriptional regulator